MWALDQHAVPQIQTPLPGPRAQALLDRDVRFVSPSYTRSYPLVVARGSGFWISALQRSSSSSPGRRLRLSAPGTAPGSRNRD